MTIAQHNGNVPENIEAIIARKGLKKKVVAERAGIKAIDLSQIIGGRKLVKISDLVAFAKALEVDPGELLQPVEKEA